MAETETQVVDAEVVEEATPVAPQAAIELARRERRSEVLRPLDSDALVASFADYQRLLQRILTSEDWQGRPSAKGSFVKKKGWRKIATAFDLDVKRVSSSVERDENGNPLRAEACYVAIAPSGRSMDGDGYCSVDEPRFANVGGRQKLENDLRATATTRAKNRAIADLVGMGAVSAEEVDSTPPSTPLPFGEAASPEVATSMRKAVAWMIGMPINHEQVTGLLGAIESRAGGYMPMIAARAVAFCAAAARDAKAAAAPPRDQDSSAGDAVETPEDRAEREHAERVMAAEQQEGTA